MLHNRRASLSYAGMAQLVEQRIRNAQVVGSSPITSSKEETMNLRFMVSSFLSRKRGKGQLVW